MIRDLLRENATGRSNRQTAPATSTMNSETSHSEDAALRRLLRELGTVAPPANFDAQLRARLEGGRPRQFGLFACLSDSLVPRFAAVACAALILIGAIHALRNSGAQDVMLRDLVSNDASSLLLASRLTASRAMEKPHATTDGVRHPSHAATTNHVGSVTSMVGVTEQAARTPTRLRAANRIRSAGVRRVPTPSADVRNFTAVTKVAAPVDQSHAHFSGDRTSEIAAAITVHARNVSVMPRNSIRDSGALVLNPVSFGGEPLASVAVAPATRRIAAAALADARERETQSAW